MTMLRETIGDALKLLGALWMAVWSVGWLYIFGTSIAILGAPTVLLDVLYGFIAYLGLISLTGIVGVDLFIVGKVVKKEL